MVPSALSGAWVDCLEERVSSGFDFVSLLQLCSAVSISVVASSCNKKCNRGSSPPWIEYFLQYLHANSSFLISFIYVEGNKFGYIFNVPPLHNGIR
ncbi:hypothetical protein FRACYDRAFT_270394 [Fragilariopsis cylindrus CCMP1102]|uniref:Uncharacterized protein n=1 Tax=Fragilariopsis cylindrus CCMP1102 TaxID=635003 RepID=A0A1E7F2Y7_9STRA|nr:hypothetical protein FRACYDRAFT_270394 [Fragilariopsis cylindrus CCMP1102]|eukprot:OEU12558.1 hypothetical protein FRACYDRAFT_270394 [Fragilariopsis cylindrus CCMP1102]